MAKYTVQGKEFNSYREIADYYGIPLTVINSRVKRWKDLEKAVSTPYEPVVTKDIEINGLKFTSLTKACEFFGLDSHSIYNRKKHSGMSIEEVILSYLRGKHYARGMWFNSLKEVCEHFKITESELNYRMMKGMTIEQALSNIERTRTKGVMLNGKAYKTLKEIAIDYNIPIQMLSSELANGNKLQDIVNKHSKRK